MMNRASLAAGFVIFAGCSALGGTDAKAAAEGPAAPAAVQSLTATTQVVAYYFHGTVRCQTCLAIEKQAGEVVEGRFGTEVALGRLMFKALNYDQPENAHYLKDYKLACPSLVLVRQKEGKDQDWTVLGQSWDFVHVPPRLDQYIEEEIRRFLEGNRLPAGLGAASSNVTTNTSMGRSIRALAELNALATEMNAVIVFLPAKGVEPAASAVAAIDRAKKGLEERLAIKIGLFTLDPGSRDYTEVAGQVPVPGLVAIVKTGVRRSVSGELTEDKIVEAFMAAVGAGGCCPLGYPREGK